MRRIAIAATMLATLASGCFSAARRLGTPPTPEHSLANPAGASGTTSSSTSSSDSSSSTSSDGSTGSNFGFRNKKAVSDAMMFGNQPESSYRDTPIP